MSSLYPSRVNRHTRSLHIAVLLTFCLRAGLTWAEAAAEADAKPAPTFQLNELRVLGNTVLDARTIEKTVYPFLGPGKSLQDVEAARAALEGVYHDGGYGTVFVDIPEQTVGENGVVRLRVTEARLRSSTVTGARYFSNRQIRIAVPESKSGTVPNLTVLQSQITKVNSVLSDRTVIPVLKAGPVPGTVDLSLKVQDRLPLHGVLEVNNQYTADTTPLRATAIVSYDNLFGHFDSATLQYQTAPQSTSDVKVFAAAFIARLGEGGNRLAATFINSSSAVATVGALGVTGKGRVYSLRFMRPWQPTPDSQSRVSVGADYKDFSQDVVVSQTSSLSTPISYASLSAAYSLSVRRPKVLWSWNTSMVLGVPGNSTVTQQFADKCFGCRANFSVLRMDGALHRELPHGFAAQVRLAGQLSRDPLISNEQFLIGGAHSVRGYLEAEDLGDVGISGSFELHGPDLMPKSPSVDVTPWLFFDAGHIRYHDPLPGQPSASGLRGWGAGFEFNAWKFLYGSVDWANPLVDGSSTRRGDPRWEFVLRSTW